MFTPLKGDMLCFKKASLVSITFAQSVKFLHVDKSLESFIELHQLNILMFLRAYWARFIALEIIFVMRIRCVIRFIISLVKNSQKWLERSSSKSRRIIFHMRFNINILHKVLIHWKIYRVSAGADQGPFVRMNNLQVWTSCPVTVFHLSKYVTIPCRRLSKYK